MPNVIVATANSKREQIRTCIFGSCFCNTQKLQDFQNESSEIATQDLCCSCFYMKSNRKNLGWAVYISRVSG